MSNIFTYLVRDTGGVIPLNVGSGPISVPIKSQHLNIDSDGNIYASNGVIDHYGAGLPFDVDGRMVISSEPVAYVDQAIPFAAGGGVSFAAGGGDPYFDQGLQFSSVGGLQGGSVAQWTPNFAGVDTYANLFSPFVPSGNDTTFSVTFYYVPNAAVQQLLGNSISFLSMLVDASQILNFNLVTGVELDASPAVSGVTFLAEGFHTLTGTLDAAADIRYIGAIIE